jgi:hypothetical protein
MSRLDQIARRLKVGRYMLESSEDTKTASAVRTRRHPYMFAGGSKTGFNYVAHEFGIRLYYSLHLYILLSLSLMFFYALADYALIHRLVSSSCLQWVRVFLSVFHTVGFFSKYILNTTIDNSNSASNSWGLNRWVTDMEGSRFFFLFQSAWNGRTPLSVVLCYHEELVM